MNVTIIAKLLSGTNDMKTVQDSISTSGSMNKTRRYNQRLNAPS